MAQKKSSMVIAPQAKQINGEQSDKNNCRSVTVHQFSPCGARRSHGLFLMPGNWSDKVQAKGPQPSSTLRHRPCRIRFAMLAQEAEGALN